MAVAFGAPRESAGDAAIEWAADTRSPVLADGVPADALERTALGRCGAQEARLRDLARVLIAGKVRGLRLPESDEIDRLRRASGEPHPWPRAWIVGGSPATEAAMRKLDAWLQEEPPRGARRCGTASGTGPDGGRVVAVVAVDALADLAALPTRARAGQWLVVEARLTVHARGGRVIVLGPGGAPRTLPTSFDGVTLRARFAPDRPGEFAVQVIADVDGGPRPVLEASVFADAEPSSAPADRAAPGEEADDARPLLEDDDRLARMITAARSLAGVRPLARDRRLDALARAHALRMAAAHDLSHDAGDGSPTDRLQLAGLDARDLGENVAHASTLALAHRAIWDSPSHRANLLGARYDRVGIGVARDDRGEAWVAEAFAGGLR